MVATASLAQVIAERDNDYRPWVTEFETRTGLPWHAPTPPTTGGASVSVVVPAHNAAYCLPTALDALAAQATSAPCEVIVVDDASDDPTPVIAADHPAVTVAVRLPRRSGAGAARNVGVRLAAGAVVVFMDADMVPRPHVLADFSARAADGLVLLGFRHGVAYRPARHGRVRLPNGEPSLLRDHRVRWRVPVGTPALPDGRVHDTPVVMWPLDRTRDFLDLGFAATYQGWDLPFMMVTSLMAVTRRAVLDAGGFAVDFDANGWGGEDTHLGARLIAAGCRVAPLRQALAFHIDPPDPHGASARKMATALDRAALCRRLLDAPAAPEAHRDGVRLLDELMAGVERLRG